MRKFQLIIIFLLPIFGFAQQLVYSPVNPAFGGDTFNYQWLLSSATAQNGFTDPSASIDSDRNGSLDQFTDGLNRQILNQISRAALGNAFDPDNLQPGTFSFGDFEIEILEGANGLIVNILDITNGEQTQIIIPN